MDYSRLDPLVSLSGEKIVNIEDWETFRREEIMVLLSNFIYGVRPMERPSDITFSMDKTEENYMGYPIIKKDITISFLGFSMLFYLFLPKETYKIKPVPIFLHVLNESSMLKFDPVNNPDNTFLPIVQMAKRGYGCAVMPTLNVSPDWTHHPDFKKGVFRAVQPDVSARNNRSWATISGWAYGASRTADLMCTVKVFSPSLIILSTLNSWRINILLLSPILTPFKKYSAMQSTPSKTRKTFFFSSENEKLRSYHHS